MTDTNTARVERTPVGAFIRGHCEQGPLLEVRCVDLFAAWKGWAEANGHRPGSAQNFGRNLRAVAPDVQVERPSVSGGGDRERWYQGIRLMPQPGRVSNDRGGEDSPPVRVPMADVTPGLPSTVTLWVLQWQLAPSRFEAATTTQQRRHAITDEHLAAVAEVYNGAPKKPARAVEEWWDTSPATASRWVKLAREAGFIKPKGKK